MVNTLRPTLVAEGDLYGVLLTYQQQRGAAVQLFGLHERRGAKCSVTIGEIRKHFQAARLLNLSTGADVKYYFKMKYFCNPALKNERDCRYWSQ